jgi:hypothetical protein
MANDPKEFQKEIHKENKRHEKRISDIAKKFLAKPTPKRKRKP